MPRHEFEQSGLIHAADCITGGLAIRLRARHGGSCYTSRMPTLNKRVLCSAVSLTMALAATLTLAVSVSAQEKGKAAKKSKILQPSMNPDFSAPPMGKLGEKPAEPWSATTLGAS